MRFIVSVFATVAIFLAAAAANAAITLTVSGVITTGANAGSTDTTLAVAGDTVVINIYATNDGGVAGATLSASGVDFSGPNGALDFAGGSSSALWFAESLSKFGAPQNGLSNIRGTSNGADGSYTSIAIPRTIGGESIFNGAIQFYSGADPANPRNGSGANDMGILDGSSGPGGTPDIGLASAGAAHAQLAFIVVGNGAVVDLGFGINDGLTDPTAPGSVGTINGTSIQIGAVPEPGTALLMGLGLSGLSLAGRRRA